MLHSIRWRLVASYVLLTLITVVALGAVALWATREYAQQQEARYLSANAKVVAQEALPLLGQRGSGSSLTQLARLASFFGDVNVRILNAQKQPVVDSGQPSRPDEFAWFVLPSDRGTWNQNGQGAGWVLGLIPDTQSLSKLDIPFLDLLPPGTEVTIITRSAEPWGSLFHFKGHSATDDQSGETGPKTLSQPTQIITYPIQDGNRIYGYVEMSSNRDFSNEALATTRRGVLLAGGFAVLLAGAIGLWMGGRLSKPVVRLTETTRQMSAGNLAVRADAGGQDEIGELATQFNQMAEQLQKSFDQLSAERDSLRRFISDASHELRTPITALKNFNDLLIQGADQNEAVRDEFLDESQVQIQRLEWITRNLLDLSRMDAGLVSLEYSQIDVPSLLDSVYNSFKPTAEQQEIRLEISEPTAQSLNLEGDRFRLEMALGNLVDNALKNTPAGGQVNIGAERGDEGVIFWVVDNGSGIHPEDLPNIFQRFYRGRNQQYSGNGLGLAIAQSIVQAHGGTISALNLPDGGARFQVQIPLKKKHG